MATATIFRPQCEINFTSLPNDIFNFGHHYDLKARDVAVLTYLISKPTGWNINRTAIANAVNMCVRTVGTALKRLQELGFVGWSRDASGKTSWFVKLVGFDTDEKASRQILLRANSAQSKNCTALETNKIINKEIKKQQTAVVVESEIVNDVIQLPEQINVPTVKQQMSKLSRDIQASVLAALTIALAGGNVKNPIGYVLGLTKKAQSGEFSPVVDNAVDNQTVVNQMPVDEKLRQICARSRDRIIANLNRQGFIHVKGYGNFTRYDLEPYLK